MTTKIKYIEYLPTGEMIWTEHCVKHHKPHKVGDIVNGFEITKVIPGNPIVYIIKATI